MYLVAVMVIDLIHIIVFGFSRVSEISCKILVPRIFLPINDRTWNFTSVRGKASATLLSIITDKYFIAEKI